jgi:hypothetical protein
MRSASTSRIDDGVDETRIYDENPSLKSVQINVPKC